MDKDRLFTGESRARQVHQDNFNLLNRVASGLDVAVTIPPLKDADSEAATRAAP